jgi:hypothetical protein
MPLNAFDRAAERLLLEIDFKENSGGAMEKIAEFTIEQVLI